MKRFKDILSELYLKENIITKLEKSFKIKMKPDRNSINGYPFDVEGHGDDIEWLVIRPVDDGVLKNLAKLLRKK